MKRFLVKHYVSANFGTLGGWCKHYFDTIDEAVADAGKWGLIIDTTTDEDITIKAKKNHA